MEYTYHQIPGWFNYQDSYAQLASNLPDGATVVEIGSFMGRSTSFLATAFWNANKQNVKAILRYLLRRQSWSPFSPEPIEFAELNFDFHPSSVRKWLNETGFDVKRQLTVSHFRIDIIKKYVPLSLLVAMDSWVQWTGDWWQLTPSVFVQCKTKGSTPAAQSDELFRCPTCGHSPLGSEAAQLICPGCHHHWAIRDGIYDFREPIG